ncbi:MAG: hypothetical protein ACREMY_29720, partial [bacterium]
MALIALVAACAAPTTPRADSGSPVASIPPAKSPTATSGSSPIPITQVGFSCRLPLVESLAGGHAQAGFVSLPAGIFALDPNAPASSVYYDRAVSRWLPVGPDAVAPDGFHYAFTDRPDTYQQSPPTRAKLHVVSVRT